MDALLILSGALVLLVGWVWLVVNSMRRSVGKMLLALFFGPLTFLLRGLGYPIWPRLLMTVGLAGIIGGSVLLHNEHPGRLEQLVAGGLSAEAAPRAGLRGTIMGQPFNPTDIDWRGDDLVFEESIDGRIRRSLTIRFGNASELLMQPVVERLPDDQGAWPELILHWHTGAMSEPGLRRVTDEYSLSLDFARTAEGETEGRIHLHLPSIHSTWLTGQIHLSATPDWLLKREQSERLVLQASQQEAAPTNADTRPQSPAWRELSLLAVMDEPDLFTGTTVRLTTWTGRTHTGTLKPPSPENRLILSIPRGPNQVELHFHSLDVRLIEESTRR